MFKIKVESVYHVKSERLDGFTINGKITGSVKVGDVFKYKLDGDDTIYSEKSMIDKLAKLYKELVLNSLFYYL